jgi:hypothetical protein
MSIPRNFDEFDPNAMIKHYVAEKIHLTTTERLEINYRDMIRRSRLFASRCKEIVNVMVFNLDTYVVGMPEETIDIDERWPEDWWQAFKERWFPEWLKRWFPVRYNELSIHQTIYKRVCPHINVEERDVHLKWLGGY